MSSSKSVPNFSQGRVGKELVNGGSFNSGLLLAQTSQFLNMSSILVLATILIDLLLRDIW